MCDDLSDIRKPNLQTSTPMELNVIESKDPSTNPRPSISKIAIGTEDANEDTNPRFYDPLMDFMDPERESQW